MIFNSYAVIQPWTMVVVSFYTTVTDGAMSRSWCSYHLTVGTKLYWINQFHQILQKKADLKFAKKVLTRKSTLLGFFKCPGFIFDAIK